MPMCHILDCRTLCPSPSGGYTGGPGRGHTAHTPYLMTAPLTPILYCSTLYLLVYKNCCTPMLWSYRPNGPRLPKAGAATTVCAPSFHTQQNRIDPPTHTHTQAKACNMFRPFGRELTWDAEGKTVRMVGHQPLHQGAFASPRGSADDQWKELLRFLPLRSRQIIWQILL